jgi:uncharacterized RDD family membrane protein YckC
MDADPFEYASFGRRLAAFFIDAVIQFVIFFLWAGVALAIFPTPPAESVVILHGTDFRYSRISESDLQDLREQLGKDTGAQRLRRIQIGGGLSLLVLYTVGFWVWRGQTPGKIALRIRIVGVDGRPIGIGRAIGRYSGYIASAVFIFIGYLMIGFDRRKQGLHDKIARTYVVRMKAR